MKKPNGIVLWDGLSMLDGKTRIVAIAVGIRSRSTNRKTGGMLQTYILQTGVDPITAVQSGADSAICGDCPLRGVNGKNRGCYVNLGQGPLAVWRAFRAGKYPAASDLEIRELGKGRRIRIGTYGDPAAVPACVWYDLLTNAAGHTGYTHQWRGIGQGLRDIVMASADSDGDRAEAWNAGFRTFRIADAPGIGEIECPSSRGIRCEDCGLCDGAGQAKSITIPAHGTGKRFAASLAA